MIKDEKLLNHPKIHWIQNNLNHLNINSSSLTESYSLLSTIPYIKEKFPNIKYIFKCTGRYFLENLNQQINFITNELIMVDLYLQKRCDINISWQNTEYYGIKLELLEKLCNICLDECTHMEKALFFLRERFNLSCYLLNPYPNDIARGGDKLILNPL